MAAGGRVVLVDGCGVGLVLGGGLGVWGSGGIGAGWAGGCMQWAVTPLKDALVVHDGLTAIVPAIFSN